MHQFGPGWPWVGTGSIEKETLQSEGSFNEDPGSESDTLMKVSTLPSLTLALTVVLMEGYEPTTDRRVVCPRERRCRRGIGLSRRRGRANASPGLKSTMKWDRKLEEAKLSCRTFCESVYTVVYLDAKNHIAQFGCIHLGDAEMSEANVLIEFNGNQVGLFFADADRGTDEFVTHLSLFLTASHPSCRLGQHGLFTGQQANCDCTCEP